MVEQAAEQDDRQRDAVVDPFAAAMSEADLLDSVRQLCRALRIPVYHTFDSRRSPEGFPDLVCIRNGEILFRELKTMKGKCTPAQLQWLDALSHVERVSVGIWRPSDWRSDLILHELRGKP